MKLLSFSHGKWLSYGAVTPSGIADLRSDESPTLKLALASEGMAALAARAAKVRTFLSPADIVWLPPIPDPDKILCVGMNYHAHVQETGGEVPAKPSLFVRFPNSLVGHAQPILKPFVSQAFDFEGELAVVIGKSGRHIAADQALSHVAGYTCLAENSLRDFQRHAPQVTPGKNFEASGAVGPWIVTSDEIPDPSALTLITRLNGREVQRTGTDDMIFSVPEVIAYISSFTRLEPGDMISTGTPSGVGTARKPPLWMQTGDVLEVEISQVGLLRNQVIDEPNPAA